MEVEMIGLSIVNSESKSRSVSPCGCSVLACSLNRSTTLINRIFKSGNSFSEKNSCG